MKALNKNWLLSLVVLFIISGSCLSQDKRNSIEESALRILAGLDRESYDYQNARTAIVRWYCEKGKYQEAAEQAATLELNDRLSLLSYIAQTASDRNDPTSAAKVLTFAWSALTETDDDVDTIWTEQLAELAARNQNLDLAKKFAARLDEGSLRKSRALLKIAASYSELQDKKEVMAIVQSALSQVVDFSDEERRDEVQIKVSAARALVAIGELDRASDLAGQIQAGLLSDPKASVEDKIGLANLFGLMGDLPRAIGIVETIDGDEKIGALMSLSQHCKVTTIERSLLDRARDQLLKGSTDGYEGSLKISNVVTGFLAADRLDDTVELLHRISEPYQLHWASIKVANVLAGQQKIDEAEAVLNFASGVARKIVSERSKDIPSSASASNAKTKSQVLSALVDAYIKLGRLSGAELAAGAIDHPQYRAINMSKIGLAYANSGNRSKAKTILIKALALSDTSEQYSHDFPIEYGLFSLIEALSNAGFATEANNAMAQLLTLIKNSESEDQFVGELFVLGKQFEASGLSTTKKVDTLFKQIEAKQNGDN